MASQAWGQEPACDQSPCRGSWGGDPWEPLEEAGKQVVFAFEGWGHGSCWVPQGRGEPLLSQPLDGQVQWGPQRVPAGPGLVRVLWFLGPELPWCLQHWGGSASPGPREPGGICWQRAHQPLPRTCPLCAWASSSLRWRLWWPPCRGTLSWAGCLQSVCQGCPWSGWSGPVSGTWSVWRLVEARAAGPAAPPSHPVLQPLGSLPVPAQVLSPCPGASGGSAPASPGQWLLLGPRVARHRARHARAHSDHAAQEAVSQARPGLSSTWVRDSGAPGPRKVPESCFLAHRWPGNREAAPPLGQPGPGPG